MGVRNLAAFNRELRAWAENRLPEEVRDGVQRVFAELTSRVVLRTPVDTGRARGGWMGEVGAPASGEGSTDKNGNGTVQRAIAAVASAKPFETIHLTNNVNYISYLEEGTSQQAPEGMLALSLAEVRQVFGP